MTLRAGILKEYRSTFLLDEQRLRKLASIFEEFGKRLGRTATTVFLVEREDDSYYITSEIDVVLAEDNPAGKSIRKLEVRLIVGDEQRDSSETAGGASAAKVVYGREVDEWMIKSTATVNMSVVEKERDWCFLFADELDGQIRRSLTSRLRPSLGRLVDYTTPIVIMSIILWGTYRLTKPYSLTKAAIAQMTMDQKLSRLLEVQERGGTTVALTTLLLLVCGTAGMSSIIYRPFSRAIDRVNRPVFYWGDAIATHDRFQERMNRFKWGVVGALAISVVGGILTTWLLGIG